MGKNDSNTDETSSVGSKILSVIITVLIVLILLGVFITCVKLDLGGIGNKVLRPVIKDVPVLNKILPKPTDEQLAIENNYSFDNLAEAVERIKELETQYDALAKNYEEVSDKTTEYIDEITRLKIFESQQLEYEENLKKFNEDIVFNENAPDIEEYKAYYEEIDPENAQEIYRQVIEQLQADETVASLAKTYSQMDPEMAAKALETNENISLVCEILTNMNEKSMAEIMDEMSSEYAAKVTNKIKSSSGAQ